MVVKVVKDTTDSFLVHLGHVSMGTMVVSGNLRNSFNILIENISIGPLGRSSFHKARVQIPLQ